MDQKEILKLLKQKKRSFRTVCEIDGIKIMMQSNFRGRYIHTLSAVTFLIFDHTAVGIKPMFLFEHVDVSEGGSDIGVFDDALLRNPGYLVLSLDIDGSLEGFTHGLQYKKYSSEVEIREAIRQEHIVLWRRAFKRLAEPRNALALQDICTRYFPDQPDISSRFCSFGETDPFQGGACNPK